MFQKALQKISVVLLLLVTVHAYGSNDTETTVTCKVYNDKVSALVLYKVENGEAVKIEMRRPGTMDTCRFSFSMDREGIYFIQKPGKGGEYNNVIYLKPGDNKVVDIYGNRLGIDFDSCKVQAPNQETVILQQWTNRFNALAKLGYNRKKHDQFINEYQQLVKDAPSLKAKAATANRYFNRLFASKLDAEIQFLKAAAFFYYGARMNAGLDTAIEHQQFYRPLATQDLCKAGLLQSEHGLALIKYNLGYKLFQKYGTQEQMAATSFNDKMKMICNDTVRTVFALDQMQQVRSYEKFKIEILPFKKLFTTTALKKIYQDKVDELTVYAKGAPAYNFSLFDTKDQRVSLSDFKGKVVVMDIWAMWCAPCLTEKPFFQEVEHSFKDRDDIVFIGISHDGLSRKDVWKGFVAKKGWKNIELLANYNESVGKYYKVEGIPRFMIFDKEGKIVTVDAPRPSDPAFKSLIEQTLETK